MAGNGPYSTIEELPDFDIEFPEGSFDPDPEEEENEDDWTDFDALPHEEDYPFGDIDDEYESRQGFDHPINWLH